MKIMRIRRGEAYRNVSNGESVLCVEGPRKCGGSSSGLVVYAQAIGDGKKVFTENDSLVALTQPEQIEFWKKAYFNLLGEREA